MRRQLLSHGSHRRGAKRGSYFFVIDGFIAATIFVSTIILVLALFVFQHPREQSYTYGSDYLEFLASTELRDHQSSVVDQMRLNGNITNMRNTIATQILLFHNQSKDGLAEQLLASTAIVLPANVAANVSIIEQDGSGTTLFLRPPLPTQTKTHLIVKSIEYAPLNQTAIYGPVILQVEVWS